ncbi:MAG TPA: toll/interleukin-1 receptor domain-containing protein, partial [Ktedonosporobacter sp.]|nr:toll/interleukin-1 receptor domain-containing protein [Ktedonosporobacter sp.]
MHTPLQLFYCYAREDRLLRDELDRHLVPLKRTSRIITWHDGEIVAGEQWAQKITEQLNTAHLILLLVSSHFLASDYCYGVEMKQALARHEADQACVIPILVSPADWADAPFSRIQILPPEAKAVTEWSHRDMAWYEVVKGIKAALTRAEKYLADEKDKAPLSPKEKRLLDAKHYEQGFRPLAVSADEEQDSLRSLRSGKERESSIPSAKDPMAQELEEREIALDPSFLFNYDKDPALSELGWRHYASRSLLLALRLLCEDINDAYAGLILPAQNSSISDSETHQDLSTIPRALVGWLERIRSFSLFLKPESAFEFPNNYTVLPLRRLLSDDADFSKDRTLLVVERQRVRLQIDKRAIRVVYRLLRPLYEDQQNWRTYFGNDVRDLVYPGIDFTPKVSDVVLNGLADMVVRLG